MGQKPGASRPIGRLRCAGLERVLAGAAPKRQGDGSDTEGFGDDSVHSNDHVIPYMFSPSAANRFLGRQLMAFVNIGFVKILFKRYFKIF
jgi:hypothetical protein